MRTIGPAQRQTHLKGQLAHAMASTTVSLSGLAPEDNGTSGQVGMALKSVRQLSFLKQRKDEDMSKLLIPGDCKKL